MPLATGLTKSVESFVKTPSVAGRHGDSRWRADPKHFMEISMEVGASEVELTQGEAKVRSDVQ